MILAAGSFQDGRTSRSVPATLRREGNALVVHDADGTVLAGPAAVAAVHIVPGVGSTPWRVRFPDGGELEAPPTPALRAIAPRRATWIGTLDGRGRWVVAALLVAAITVWAAVRWGIPAAARLAAHLVPQEHAVALGRDAFAAMDRATLAPSALPELRRQALRARLAPLMRRHAGGWPVRLHFRRLGETANAFAFPSGDIVVTDRLVEIAGDDEEIAAVVAHELGHVVRRHAVRNMLERSLLSLAVFLFAGDVSSLAGQAAAIPAFLVRLGYSRDMEREADDYAVAVLRREGIAPRHLADLLQRLEAASCPQGRAGADCPRLPGWLSTHPITRERIARIRAGV